MLGGRAELKLGLMEEGLRRVSMKKANTFVFWLLQTQYLNFSSYQLRSNATVYCPLVYCDSK